MKIDFHTHGKLAKYLPFSDVYTDWLFDRAKRSGLDAICLTEHFNTTEFEKIYSYINDHSTMSHDALIYKNGLKIFAGMETDVFEGGHILLIGRMEDILALNRRLELHKTKETFLSFHDLMELLSQYDVIVGNAHPFREGGHVPSCDPDDLARLFFVDLNGKDVAMDKEKTEELVYAYANKLNKPVVGGSDTHQALQYGCIRNDFVEDIDTLDGLRKAMKEGAYTIVIDERAKEKVEAASLLKKCLKRIDALGGDYVSMLVENSSLV